MATKAQLETALRNAHAAGDTEAAQRFAAELAKEPAGTKKGLLPQWDSPMQAFGDLLRVGSDAITMGTIDDLRVLLGSQPDIETARGATQESVARSGLPGDLVGAVSAAAPMMAMPQVAIPARAGPVLQAGGRAGVGVLEGMGWGGMDALGHDEDVSEGMIGGGVAGLLGTGASSIVGRGIDKVGDWFGGGPKGLSPKDLKLERSRAYNAMEDENVKFSPTGVDDLITRIDKETKDAYPGVQDATIAARKRAKKNLRAGGRGFNRSRSMTEIDKERQNFKRDVVQNRETTNKPYGQKMVKALDDWMEDAVNNPAWVSSRTGNPDEALGLLQRGRELNTREEKLDLIDEKLGKAERQSDRSLNTAEDSAIKNNLASIYDNPDLRSQYTPEELEQMLIVNSGTAGQQLMRQASRAAPGKGLGWQAAAAGGGLGFMVGGPPGAAIGSALPPLLGILAGKASSRATRKESEKLRQMVSSGKSGKKIPAINSKAQRELARLLTALGITSSED